jgi:hypothetical protein
MQEWWQKHPVWRQKALVLVQHGLQYMLSAYVPAPDQPGRVLPGQEAPWQAQDAIVYLVRLAVQSSQDACSYLAKFVAAHADVMWALCSCSPGSY